MPTKTSGFFLQRGTGGPRVLDVLAPRPGAPGIGHHARDEGAAAPAWRLAAVLGEELGAVSAVSLIESNFGAPGHLEAVALAGGRLAAFWRGAEPGARWSGAQVFAEGVAGNPALIQGGFGHRGHFELVAPLERGGLGHFRRDNDSAALAWRGPAVFGEGVRFDAVAMIHGNYGSLEVIARAGDRLVSFWRSADVPWRGPFDVVSGVGGRPALLQGRAGRRGHFELVAPLATVGLGHWFRDNDDPAVPWRGPAVLATELGRCDEVSLVEREAGPPGRLEVVVRAGDRLVHISREGGVWAQRTSFLAVPRPAPAPESAPAVESAPAPAAGSGPAAESAAESGPVPGPAAESAPAPAPAPGSAPAADSVAAAAAPPIASPPPPRAARPPPPRPRWSPLDSGPHRAGFRRIVDMPLSEQARYPDARPFEGLIYRCPERGLALLHYPAAADGEDAPVAPGGPFPVIAIAHARRLRSAGVRPGAPEDPSQDYRQLTGLMAHLARRGFVVIAPDLSWLAPDDGPARRAAALRDALSSLRAGSRGPLLADFDRAGLIGHGHGGLAAAALAIDRACPFHVRALGLIAPLPPRGAAALAGGPPVLILRGGADTGAAGAGAGPAALFELAPPPKTLVTIPGANHFGYTTSIALAAPLDGEPGIGRRDQQRIARAYLTALFERHARGREEADAWLSGELPIPQLESTSGAASPEALGVEVRAEMEPA